MTSSSFARLVHADDADGVIELVDQRRLTGRLDDFEGDRAWPGARDASGTQKRRAVS